MYFTPEMTLYANNLELSVTIQHWQRYFTYIKMRQRRHASLKPVRSGERESQFRVRLSLANAEASAVRVDKDRKYHLSSLSFALTEFAD